MKFLKKLLAIALAGVLALTMLTGCAQSVNEKQLVDALNDLHYLSRYDIDTIVQGDNKLANQVLGEIKTYITTHPQPGPNADAVFEMYGPRNSYFPASSFTDITKDSKDAYYYTYMRLNEFQSKEFSENRTAQIAQLLAYKGIPRPLNEVDSETTLETTATASIATDKIGDYEYLVIIFVQKAKASATN